MPPNSTRAVYIGNLNDLFPRPWRPPHHLVAHPRCPRLCLPTCLAPPPWRTPYPGTPWAPCVTETSPCHASAPAAGAALSAAGRPQAHATGHGQNGWLVKSRLRGWGGSEGAAANGSGRAANAMRTAYASRVRARLGKIKPLFTRAHPPAWSWPIMPVKVAVGREDLLW
jgi:hypothetical protein